MRFAARDNFTGLFQVMQATAHGSLRDSANDAQSVDGWAGFSLFVGVIGQRDQNFEIHAVHGVRRFNDRLKISI